MLMLERPDLITRLGADTTAMVVSAVAPSSSCPARTEAVVSEYYTGRYVFEARLRPSGRRRV